MKRSFFIVIFTILLSTNLLSQYYWDIGLRLGGANYLGEIGGKEKTRRDFILDMKLHQTRWAIGAFGRYKLFPFASVRASLYYARLQGADKFSTNRGRVGRNLSFRNDIFELSAIAEYYFYNIFDVGRTGMYRLDFRAYTYLGFGVFYNNPKTKYNGKWYALRPLKTEGQEKEYGLFQPAIPLGMGFYYTYKRKYRFGFQMGWRLTFTDYIDDISTVYPDPDKLDSDLARKLSNRRDELPPDVDAPDPANYAPGNKRGDPTHNDAYLFATINFAYVIRGRSNFYRAKYSFIFDNRKKRKRRKFRQRF